MVPFTFRIRVSHWTQEPPFEFLPAAPGIRQSASRRTFPGSRRHASPSPALPRRARPAVSAPRSGRRAGRPACARAVWPSSFSAPSLRCLRQYVKCDEYRPSRRSSSPTSPGRVHASALARISRLVLRRELPALGLLDQLRVRDPRRRGAPAGHESQLGYASWSSRPAAAASTAAPTPFVLVSHVRRSPFSPSRSLIPRW